MVFGLDKLQNEKLIKNDASAPRKSEVLDRWNFL